MGIKYCPDCTREWGVLDERTNRFESRAARYCGTCGRPVHGYHPPNPPLTLDELREMDGEPVWQEMIIPCEGCCSGWEILSKRDIDWICENAAIIYGKAFVYYRRRPEEVPK